MGEPDHFLYQPVLSLAPPGPGAVSLRELYFSRGRVPLSLSGLFFARLTLFVPHRSYRSRRLFFRERQLSSPGRGFFLARTGMARASRTEAFSLTWVCLSLFPQPGYFSDPSGGRAPVSFRGVPLSFSRAGQGHPLALFIPHLTPLATDEGFHRGGCRHPSVVVFLFRIYGLLSFS